MDQMKARLPLALRFVPSDIVKNIGSAKVISLWPYYDRELQTLH
jgi:hypothetical protein